MLYADDLIVVNAGNSKLLTTSTKLAPSHPDCQNKAKKEFCGYYKGIVLRVYFTRSCTVECNKACNTMVKMEPVCECGSVALSIERTTGTSDSTDVRPCTADPAC